MESVSSTKPSLRCEDSYPSEPRGPALRSQDTAIYDRRHRGRWIGVHPERRAREVAVTAKERLKAYDVMAPTCPSRVVLNRIGARWTIFVVVAQIGRAHV